jgi:hypothetical protein
VSAVVQRLYAVQEVDGPATDAASTYTAQRCNRSADAVHDGKARTVERLGNRDISVA